MQNKIFIKIKLKQVYKYMIKTYEEIIFCILNIELNN